MITEPERWKVLMVDDEPVVHEVSRLILDGLRFEDREIELLTAGSAAEARELLARHPGIALALIDVVMETDDAGILLVQHIRDRLRDSDMQIVLRTGQPGVAPEADLMHRCEINGYFLKTEITAQRLNSIVISGLRGYRHTRGLRTHQPPPTVSHDPAREALARELSSLDESSAALLHVQPEVALARREVTGAELVPQWRTSAGLLTAARVHDAVPGGPTAERMLRWLLGQAVFWARAWQSELGRPLVVSLPLAGESLADAAITALIVETVRDAGLPRGTLDLIVGESVLLGGHAAVRPAVEALRAAGLTLTLADFGARTIPLSQLSGVAPDRLKLHRLAVRDVARAPERMALARSLLALGQTLRVVSIADGLASDDDLQFFRWEGCELGQGEALAPACAPRDLAGYVRSGWRSAH